MKCLIVDDDPGLLSVMHHYLCHHLPLNWMVYAAPNGLIARKLLHQHRGAHILITDRHMPGETGISLLQFTSEIWPNTRFILISSDQENLTIVKEDQSYVHFPHQQRLEGKGIFLKKPFSMNTLLESVQKLTTV
ncbi:nitrogen regulation protein NR(I) [Holospora obtusa F1]|uniref:Nitrogen regulation protein NR(I) n=1 Tax=Holospora obtusa F1 TaxID=1399147 RepID=W6TEE4_HOLOB|nr:response regulator [Holospora obtusa]ETZ07079.1 nitrogen regulation protein NR(I) [Holospora obtusa F1]